MVFLQVVDHPAAGDSVQETQRVRRLPRAIGDDVEVVWHDDVSKDRESTRGTRFLKGGADNLLQRVGTEHRQTVVRYTGDGKARVVAANRHHGGVEAQPQNPENKGSASGKAEPFRKSGGGALIAAP